MNVLSNDAAKLSARPKASAAPLYETYWKTFEARLADTPVLRAEAHRLRYQVYCVEHDFLDPADNPGGLERDKHDAHSVQVVLLHRESGTTVGTMRLVLHKPGATSGSLPFHEVCERARQIDPALLPLETTAELSRFAISRAFRRRIGDGDYGRPNDADDLLKDGRRVIPHITLGLMTTALRVGVQRGVTHICAVMDPALLRLLTRFGIRFDPLGEPVDYHGWRQPCYAELREFFANIEAERPDVWDVITDCGRLWKSHPLSKGAPSDDGFPLVENRRDAGAKACQGND